MTPVPAPAAIDKVAIGALSPSHSHIQDLRRSRFSEKDIKELADDIKRNGLLHFPIVRPRSEQGKYEIVTGEQRWLAQKLLGYKEVLVNVRTLTDEQALEMQLSENLRRKNLHELEEAEGYEELMKLQKVSADVLADTLGRSRSYVARRTKLLALCPDARKAFYAGTIDAARALLIARIPHHDTQLAALKDITTGRYQGDEPLSYREALHHVQHAYMLALKDAPFDIKDASLVPKAGDCIKCPKRTGNQKDLFADVKSGDVCTDPVCFDGKRQATYFVAVKQLQAKGKKVLHGDAAKKVFPHWKNGSSSMSQGYVDMASTMWTGTANVKVATLLGHDYQPILVQHPANGKILEVATQQAVAKASTDPKLKKKAAAAVARASKPKGPDVDEALLHRLVKLIGDKAPKTFGKPHLIALTSRLHSLLNTRDNELDAISTYYHWPKNAWRKSYKAVLPAQTQKLDERGLMLLLWQIVFTCSRWERKPVLDVFGIDEAKTRELVIGERKAAAKAARLAGKGKGKK